MGVYISGIVILYLIFKISILFSIVDTPFYISTAMHQGSRVFKFLSIFFPNSHPMASYYGFDLQFSNGSAGKESACNVGDLGSIPGLGRSPGEGKDYPLQYSGLENSVDYIVHGVTKSRTGLSDFHFH